MLWLGTAVERAMKRQEVILRAALAPHGWPQTRSTAGAARARWKKAK